LEGILVLPGLLKVKQQETIISAQRAAVELKITTQTFMKKILLPVVIFITGTFKWPKKNV
jgi:hypothetical protein